MIRRVSIVFQRLLQRLCTIGEGCLRSLYQRYADLKITQKLNLSFGVLVTINFFVVGMIFVGGLNVSHTLGNTQKIHFPAALISAQAQANLLRMLVNLQGYLATGESEVRNQYQVARHQFEQNLEQMEQLTQKGPMMLGVSAQVETLRQRYHQWVTLPERLFTLRDNTIENQPALRRLESDGNNLTAQILRGMEEISVLQSQRAATQQNLAVLSTIFQFKGAFGLAVASLQSYLVTRTPSFRFDYADHAKVTEAAWQTLTEQAMDLTVPQQVILERVETAYNRYLNLVPELFQLAESDRYRQDLYLFQTEAEPISIEILMLLDGIVNHEQRILSDQIQASQTWLRVTQVQIIVGGALTLGMAIALGFLLRHDLAFPIQRLTQVITQVCQGDYEAKAEVTSQDEMGVLALSLNEMTTSLARSRSRLEQYSRSLETQVALRTQELQSKNTQLINTLRDLQQTQSQLIQTEKMSSLGQLVAGVAHEINNPVNFISGNVTHASDYAKNLIDLIRLYQTEYPTPSPKIAGKIQEIDLDFVLEDMPKLLRSMTLGTSRIQEIVASLRTFSRMDEAEMKAVDIHEGLESTLMILHSRLKSSAQRTEIVVKKCYASLPLVECYPGQLNQVFMNILTNAIDALDECCKADENFKPLIEISTEQEQADHIKIRIADNGLGIPTEVQHRLFDPFYTTKPVGKGTGLGLSISYQIVVDRHGGSLVCKSQPGSGAAFLITIPCQVVQPALS
ncbi:MAG: CHASE3 domain-containing protein [Leptolyngbyaceae cyanobacterium T60_A2020_046]|nr:CHASE3 domain-containing protein [Leptolyngbyaceae cyanobacterium T60_A2020_046]